MAYFQHQQFTKLPKRIKEDYFEPSRSELVNHLKTEIKKKPRYRLGDFLTRSLWSWIYHYFKSRFGRKFPYPSYTPPDDGIYQLEPGSGDGETTICVASDWATDTEDSFAIAAKMREHNPDYTIHVGDTYYVGAPPEIISNFVEDGSPWIRGCKGSFALLGNHEMYARGDAFFEKLLPTLGLRNEKGAYTGQKAGYFCLQNDYWRIIGLDTGYHSTGKPLLEFLPWFAPDCRLPDAIMQWLKDVVKLDNPDDRRGIVVLTHHQYISAFNKESEYKEPAKQLASLLGSERKILWFWGHEHKLALYGKAKVDGGPTAYGRCIGNGGTPVEIDGKSFQPSKKKQGYTRLIFVDRREQKMMQKIRLGFNSYIKMKIRDNNLKVEYYDNQHYMFSETWNANPATGDISGKMDVPLHSTLITFDGKEWADAVI